MACTWLLQLDLAGDFHAPCVCTCTWCTCESLRHCICSCSQAQLPFNSLATSDSFLLLYTDLKIFLPFAVNPAILLSFSFQNYFFEEQPPNREHFFNVIYKTQQLNVAILFSFISRQSQKLQSCFLIFLHFSVCSIISTKKEKTNQTKNHRKTK